VTIRAEEVSLGASATGRGGARAEWYDLPAVDIDPDIRRAEMPPSALYTDPAWYARMRERIFARTWHMFPAHLEPLEPGALQPWNLLPGCLDEPLLLTRDDAGPHLISNVCTHRGAILVERPGQAQGLRCGYHGRRFALDGRFGSAPSFAEAEGFPRPCDDLARVPLDRWERFWFASLDPAHRFDDLVAPVRERLAHLPWDRLVLAPDRCRDYHVAASWALYCDNYLEGLHIPFVHPGLDPVLDREGYQTQLLPLGVLQLGVAASDEQPCLSAPPDHPDHGRPIAAYYYWLYPCTMLNVYPWGLSINVVIPLGPERTRVVFLGYTWDPAAAEAGAGADLDHVEHEDERILQSVARGARARLLPRGRYSPSHEQGVHHFHRLLARSLNDEG